MATSTTETAPRTAGLYLAGLTVAAPAVLALAAPGTLVPMLAIVLPFFTMLMLEGPTAHSAPAAPEAKSRSATLAIEPRLTGRISVA